MDSSIDAPLHLCILYFLLYFAFCFNWINYACEVRLFVPCSIFVYLFILFDSGHANHRFLKEKAQVAYVVSLTGTDVTVLRPCAGLHPQVLMAWVKPIMQAAVV